MSSHFLVDKSLSLEARWGAFDTAAAGRPFEEPGAPERYGPNREFAIERLEIGLEIDPRSGDMTGDTTVHVGPLPWGMGQILLDLGDVTVTDVTDADGAALDWTHRDDTLLVRGVPEDGGAINVRYHGRPGRGLYFTGPTRAEPDRPYMAWTQCQDEDGHHVFPCIDHPSVKCPVSVTVRAPSAYDVVGNGRLAEQNADGDGWSTWRWEQPDPIPAYLVTVVVGEFVIVEDTADTVPLRYLAPKGTDPAVIRRVFANTPKMVKVLSEVYGLPYPWARYDQVIVHDFIFGGMENVAATTLTDLVLTDDRAALDWDAEDLIAHELAHQWFGDLITCQDWSQGWLNEGWATWSEFLYKRVAEGQDEADYALFGQLTDYLGEDAGRYRRSLVHYRFRNPIDLFDRHLYEKGALVLHTLHHLLGADRFWAGVRLYLARRGHDTAHTRHFQRAMEDGTGRNLDAFFRQFVTGAGHPELAVTVGHADGLLTVAVEQTQTGPNVSDAFEFRLDVRVVHGDTSTVHQLPVSQRARTWALPCGDMPTRVEVDADFHVLADLTLKGPRSLLLASLTGDQSVVGRIRAARALAKQGSAKAMAALFAALRADPFWGVRAAIAGLLATQAGEAAQAALIGALSDPHPKSRRAIVAALGTLRNPTVAHALRNILDGDEPFLQVEATTLRALGNQRQAEDLPRLRAALNRGSWGEVLRAQALAGMGASQHPDVLADLLANTTDAHKPRARAAAAAALGQLADEVESTRRAAVDRLLLLAVDSPFRVRLAAIGALGRAGDMRAVSRLNQLHGSDPDGRLRRTCFEAARRIRKGRSSEAALAGVRGELEKLRTQTTTLRDRIERIEPSPES